MPTNRPINHLGNKHYRVLVIRLLVDQRGNLDHGIVVDLNEQQVGHFRQLDALPALVAHWLSAQEGEQSTLDLNNSSSD